MERFRIKPMTLFLSDEKMLIDTEKRLIRKYNESACKIIELLTHEAITMAELKRGLESDTACSGIRPKDLTEFIQYMKNADILEVTDSSE